MLKRYSSIPLLGFILASISLATVFAACGSSNADETSGVESSNGTTTTSTGSGSSGFQSSGGVDEPLPMPPPPPGPDAGPDADPDASFTCDGLDQSKPVILYLSADDSNSMGSPTYAREVLKMGIAPPAGMIRTYEFLNYYRIAYTAPPVGELSIFPHMETALNAGEYNLQLGIRSFDAPKPRRPITVTFVLDTSGSMGGPGIEREKAAATAIAQSLADGDIVNMVSWNTDNNILLSGHAVSGPSDSTLLAAINALSASGGTDLNSGLVSGYKLAQQHYGPSRLNRVILISDGGANVGVTDEDLIAQHSQDADKEGIYLVGVGAGPADYYNDILMDAVTDKGRGAYIYLDRPEEANAMFVDRFDETMEVAARGVQVELTMPWYFKMEKFFGEEYSSNPEEVEPQHLAPSDAMIFNQIIKACDPAIVNPDDPITIKATWETPITYEKRETSVTVTVDQLLTALNKTPLLKGKAIVAYAEALKTATAESLTDAHTQVIAANPNGTDPELKEIQTLIEIHPNYKP